MSKSSSRNPMELVDRYLQAVRFWLPKDKRQQDLLAELGEDLRSQIDEKEAELARSLNEDDVAAVLKRCGAPMIVASRLGPKRHLIGPALFPIYAFVLKIVLVWILLPLFLVVLGPVNVAKTGGDWGVALASTLGQMWYAMLMAAGIITLIFAIVERSGALEKLPGNSGLACNWDPHNLPPIEKHERKTSLTNTVAELVANVFALNWLLLLPHHPFLILGPAEALLHAAPLVHTFYVPIVVLSVILILRGAIMLARPHWSLFPQASMLFNEALLFIVLSLVLNSAATTPGGSWAPFVTLLPGLANPMHYVKVPAIVNVSILISLVIGWFVQGIAIIVHSWQLRQRIRERKAVTGHAATISML